MDATIARARELKDTLTDFIYDAEGELAVALETFSAQQMSRSADRDMNQRNLIVDRFIIEGKIGEKTPIAIFLEDTPELTSSDRDLINRWQQGIIGLFAIVEILDDGFELMNWTTEKRYTVRTAEAIDRYKMGEILLAQIAPLDDGNWMFFSNCTTLGKLGKPKLAVAIGNFKQAYRNYLYSDAPELLEEAWRSVENYHNDFIEFFGSDEVIMPGYQLTKKLSEFQEKTTEQQLKASGLDGSKSLEELAEDAGFSSEDIQLAAEEMGADAKVAKQILNSKATTKMVQPQIELPDRLKKAEQVTMISHPRWGQMFLPTYHQFKQILSAEDWKTIPNAEKLIRHYLESPEINSYIWQRLAFEYPTQLETILREILERPDFNLTEDMPGLMAEFNKPLEVDLPETASVPLHLHNLFQDAVIEINKSSSKDRKPKKKTGQGFKK